MAITEMLVWILLGFAAIVALCFVVLWAEKNFPGEEYDERQQIARGKAYRVGFYVGGIWYMVPIMYIKSGGNMDGMLLVVFFGFLAQNMAFHIYCLLTHAALPMSQKPVTTIVSYGVLAVSQVVYLMIGIDLDGRWPDKPPVMTWLYLSMAVGFSALCVMHLIQYLREKKEKSWAETTP